MIIRRIRDIFQAFRCSERKPEPAAVENAGKTSLPPPEPRDLPFMQIDLPQGVVMFSRPGEFLAACKRWVPRGAVYFPADGAPPRLNICECSMTHILANPLAMVGEDQFGPCAAEMASRQWGQA